MAYKVMISTPAHDDIDETVAYILRDSTDAAGKWLSGLESTIQSLSETPTKYQRVQDTLQLLNTYRYTIYFSHRVIYRIDETSKIVYVVRVYHGARRPLKNSDIAE